MTSPGTESVSALPPVNDDTITETEERAFRAWPAEVQSRLAGWVMRHDNVSPTRRANSVFAGPVGDSVNLDGLLSQVESHYANLGKPPRFQISPVSSPAGLEQQLEARGYQSEGHTMVSWALASDVVTSGGDFLDGVQFSNEVSDDWEAVYANSIGDADVAQARMALFRRIRRDTAFVTVHRDNRPVAMGLGVFDEGWTGVFSMFTAPDFRRQGLARGIVSSLAHWTEEIGGSYMYLQVEDDNDAARAIYEQCGFNPVYPYHYRTLTQ